MRDINQMNREHDAYVRRQMDKYYDERHVKYCTCEHKLADHDTVSGGCDLCECSKFEEAYE